MDVTLKQQSSSSKIKYASYHGNKQQAFKTNLDKRLAGDPAIGPVLAATPSSVKRDGDGGKRVEDERKREGDEGERDKDEENDEERRLRLALGGRLDLIVAIA